MKRTVAVRMVSSSGCERCVAVEKRILAAASKLGVKIEIEKIDSRDDKAIDLGVDYGLTDVPSFVVAGCTAFSGDSFDDSTLESAIANAEAKRKSQ